MSLRFRLTLGLITVILVAYAFLSIATVLHINRVFLHEVQNRVRLDLNSAHRVFDSRSAQIIELFESLIALHGPLTDIDSLKSDCAKLWTNLNSRYDIDMISVISPEGAILFRAHHPQASGDDFQWNPLFQNAGPPTRAVRGTFLIPIDTLQRDGDDLAGRTQVEIKETPAARPSILNRLEAGMATGALVPVQGADGKLAAYLYGASLLNGNFDIVDEIRDEVFHEETLEGRPIGQATVFQGDVRIATNVMTLKGERAVGTRLSEAVHQKTLDQGEVYADKAFVVNDWYITAYEPIRNPSDEIIGALYVGILEAPFTQPQRMIEMVFLLMVLGSVIATLLLLFILIQRMLRPLPPIVNMARRFIEGDHSARVGIRPGDDMGVVCETLDRMADAFEERQRQIQQTAQRQIGQSDKLASLGRLTAGIAHEINNPLTGVLTFAHLLRDKRHMTEDDRNDLDVIIHETKRVSEIVRGMLDFARESPMAKTSLQLNETIERTIRLIEANKEFRHIKIQTSLDPELPMVLADRNQMQQVMLNLCINACEAMQEKGTLRIESKYLNDNVIVSVADDGHGIAPDLLEKIFDPFFTTKPVGKGTGLGLSVSYGIIQSHHGRLEVESIEGEGTVFTIHLPIRNSHNNETQSLEAMES